MTGQPKQCFLIAMHLLSLQIRNFRVLKEVNLEFPDNIIGIIGPNGAGKSSLIEAIAWALYGHQAARSGKDEIKAGFARAGDDCQVTLDFKIHGESYRVLRRLTGRTERPEVELYRGAGAESVGSTETRKYIEHLLGLDWRGFFTSFLARQQELNALSDLQPSKRREHLAGMLGIEKLDRALQKVKEDNRLFEEKVVFLQKQLTEKEPVKRRLAELAEHEKTLAERYEKESGAFAELKQAYEAISMQYKREHEKKMTCSALAARLEATLKTRDNVVENHNRLTAELNTLQTSRQVLEELEKELADFDRLKKEFESQKDARNKIRFREELGHRRETTARELDRLQKKELETRQNLDTIRDGLKAIPDEIETLVTAAESRLNALRDEYAALKAERENRQKELGKLREQIKAIREIGPGAVCDRCRRPFGDDLPKIKLHLDRELKELLDSLNQFEKLLPEKKAEGLKIKEKVDELDRGRRRKFELTSQLDNVRKEMAEITVQKEKHQAELDRLAGQLAELEKLVFDPAEYSRLEAQLSRLEKKQVQYNQLQGSLRRIPAVTEEIAAAAGKLAALNEETDRFKAELAGLEFDELVFEKVKAAFEDLQKKFDDGKSALVELNKEMELVKKEIQLKGEQLAGFENAERDLEDCRTGHFYGEKLGLLLADFRKQVIASIRPRLAELSSALFSEMTDSRFNLVELDENYNLKVMDYGQFFGVERFSGGEKDLANLCLRLAISLALTESAGLDRSFVILDEVFGSQDNVRKELILKGLANLKKRFPQMLLVTHIEEIKNSVETLIEVVPTGAGWSEVRVNGTKI